MIARLAASHHFPPSQWRPSQLVNDVMCNIEKLGTAGSGPGDEAIGTAESVTACCDF